MVYLFPPCCTSDPSKGPNTDQDASSSEAEEQNTDQDASFSEEEEEQSVKSEVIDQTSTTTTNSQRLEAAAINQSETQNTQQYASFLGVSPSKIKTTAESQVILQEIAASTGIKTAIIYVNFVPQKGVPRSRGLLKTVQDSDVLNIGVVTANGVPVKKPISGVTRKQVLDEFKKLSQEITDPGKAQSTSYLASSQKIYQWLIASQEAELQKQGINNLMFVMDEGMRSLPVAALHDGKQFLVEKYSLGILPSFSLTKTGSQSIRNSPVLAMGAEKFTVDQSQTELGAVPIEVTSIVRQIKGGKYLLNEDFNFTNLKAQTTATAYQIIHLATHADFPNKQRGGIKESYIQLYDSKLRYDQIAELGWNRNKLPVELLVLSACKTAAGDEEAEMGFAGLAIKTGVNTVLASLWYASDPGTLGLMTEFYRSLKTAKSKTEALRAAQLAMIRGEVRIEDNQLIGSQSSIKITTEQSEYLQDNIVGNLSHPYNWAAFTMIGNPW
ncbi:CHAT domain-containing protein [Anabaena sp. CCY 0017]|uniref:CHAT domain-containing protein n=1 Tax=Anabaena sp. CCY 0017 TaxID=3103866 RepID=UPI0039C6DF59